MDVKVMDLVGEVEDGPFLHAVGPDLDDRRRHTTHRIGLDDGIRPGHFRDVEVCLAAFRPRIFGERKTPPAHRCAHGQQVIDALQCRPRRSRSLPARGSWGKRIDPDRHQVAGRHQVSGATRRHCLSPQDNAMLRRRDVELDVELDAPAGRHHDRVGACLRLRLPHLVGERHAIEADNLDRNASNDA